MVPSSMYGRKNCNLSKSEELLKNALNIDPNDLFGLRNYGELKLDQNNYQEAIKIFEKIVKQLEKNKGSVFSTCQFIDNPFRHKKELVKLIHRRELDKIFFNLLITARNAISLGLFIHSKNTDLFTVLFIF
mgnify:CR=1 FL=1